MHLQRRLPPRSWASAGGAKWAFSSPRKLGLRKKIYRKPEVSSLIALNSLNSCNDILFAGMTLILHKSQFHCSGVMQCWACGSLMSAPLLVEAGCKTCEWIARLAYCWPLMHNINITATNLQRNSWSYGSRRFAACDCRTQVMQRAVA